MTQQKEVIRIKKASLHRLKLYPNQIIVIKILLKYHKFFLVNTK